MVCMRGAEGGSQIYMTATQNTVHADLKETLGMSLQKATNIDTERTSHLGIGMLVGVIMTMVAMTAVIVRGSVMATANRKRDTGLKTLCTVTTGIVIGVTNTATMSRVRLDEFRGHG